MVTIIIPSFNAGQKLSAAVASALSQEYEDFEVIVIDDGSTDGSSKSLPRDPRLHLIRQKNAGKSVAINRALTQARGDRYCILDADDLMDSDRILQQSRELDSHPDIAAVFCGHRLLIDDTPCAPRFREKNQEQCRNDIEQFRMPAHDPTGLYRLSMVRDILYDPELRIGQGYDYILRVGERFPMRVLGKTLYSYRIGTTSATRADPVRRKSFVELVQRKACVRRGVDYDKLFRKPRRTRTNNRDRDNSLAVHFIESVTDLRQVGRTREAIRTGFQCFQLHPADPFYSRPLAYAILPSAIVAAIRGRGRNGVREQLPMR